MSVISGLLSMRRSSATRALSECDTDQLTDLLETVFASIIDAT
jgi:hypothetical protein